MGRIERANRGDREDALSERHLKITVPESVNENVSVADEGFVGNKFEPAFERHAAMLTGSRSDVQRAGLALHLQRTYGNTYVQRLMESMKATADINAQRQEEEEIVEAKSDIYRQEEEEEPVIEVHTKMSGIQRQSAEPDEEEQLAAKPDSKVKPSIECNLQRQKGMPGGTEKPPKTTSDPKEVAAKVLEAASKTEIGKKFTKKLMTAATSEEGIVILSTLAVPALTVAFAEKMEVPKGLVGLVPKIAKFEVGKNVEVSFQPIYKGKLGEAPKEWGGMVYLTVKRW